MIYSFVSTKRNDMTSKEITTETGLKYTVRKDGRSIKLNLVTKVGRSQYYSCLNEIGLHFEELVSTDEIKKYINL